MKFQCPHCKKPSLSLKQKYLTGKWLEVYCPDCGGRICAQPIILAVLSFLYAWDVMLFGYVALAKHSWFYLGVLLGGWLILDIFSLSCPVSRMRPKPDNTQSPE